ncbi:ABC transporter permease [Bifidobacterium saguinibicoloris]|uniref:ABC transporter permease n=1 Tax=Bifidobacterium saguinibicoloris TaxID=2834433 RepID=UPI001C56EFCB|nr:ABC transporter permease [Bifidobacterium saguinibicoloris]MBW3080444.1 ABC transporter permease [Bifidobacterium saguinibicoloris]
MSELSVAPVERAAVNGAVVSVLRPAAGITLSERLRSTLSYPLRHPATFLAGVVAALVIVSALLPQLVTPVDPTRTVPADKLLAPGAAHWFGTDQLGRDMFARVVYGGRATISASLLSLAIAALGGLAIGIVAGYAGRAVDAAVMRLVDVLLAIPGLMLAITIVTAIGFGTIPVAIAIGIGMIPAFARTTRSQVLTVKERSYVDAARVCGCSPLRIVLTHILPNSLGPVVVLALLDFGRVIMAVATLSFLGFGAKPPAAEWGTLINDGKNYLLTSPWVPLIPGLVVVATVLSVTVLANAAKKAVNQ